MPAKRVRIKKPLWRYGFAVLVAAWRSARQRSADKALETQERQELLRRSEDRYRAVVEQAAEAIFLVDVGSKRILETNVAWRNLLGYTPEETSGLTLYDVVAHARDSVDDHIRRILEQEKHSIGERHYERKDGSLVDVEVNASVISYGGRDVLCVVARDITERKRREDTLRFLSEASTVLSSSLDYRETLTSVARLAVLHLADWCAIDVLEGDGAVNNLTVVHHDPRRVALAQQLRSVTLQTPRRPTGCPTC